jgi:hypothetical protein
MSQYQPPMPSAAPPRPVNQTMKTLAILFFSVAFACSFLSLAFGVFMALFAAVLQVTAFVCLCLI